MKYLIVKTSAFGDVVQAFAAVQYLKRLQPDAQIDWVCEKKIAPLARAHPDVHEVIEIDAKRWKKNLFNKETWKEGSKFLKNLRKTSYDAVFDLQGNTKSGCITFFTKAVAKVGFGWKTASERLNCLSTKYKVDPQAKQNIREDYISILQSYFQDFSRGPIVEIKLQLTEWEQNELSHIQKQLPGKNIWMVCPGSQWINKRVKTETLIEFLKATHKKYEAFFVFTAASIDELNQAKILSSHFPASYICDHVSLPILQNLMSQMDLVVSMDSLPLHLAATTKTKTFSFFGPSLSDKYKPLGEVHFSYQGSCPYGYTFEKRCPILRSCKTGACIRDMQAEEAFTAFTNWWRVYQIQ